MTEWNGNERRNQETGVTAQKLVNSFWNLLPYIISLISVYVSLNNKLIIVTEQFDYAKKEIMYIQDVQKGIVKELNDRSTSILLFKEKFKDTDIKVNEIVFEIKGINYKLVEFDKKLEKNKRGYNAMPD